MLCMAAGPSTTDRCAYGVIAGLDELCARRVPKESATGSRSVGDRPQPPRTGLLALTFGTLLSSQGAGAHRYRTSRSVSGQLAKRYSVGFAVSNPEVCPRTTRPSLFGRGIRGVGGMEPVPSGDQPAFGAWDTLGGQWQRSQIRFRRSPGPWFGVIVDPRQRWRSSPPARRRVSPDPDRTGLEGHILRVAGRPHGLAPTLKPSQSSIRDRTGRVAGGTSSRRLSGGLMLVTTAVDPLRRPTSDPASQLTVGAGCSLRRAPDGRGARSGRCPRYEPTWCWRPARSSVPTVGPRCGRPVGLPRPATTLPAVSDGPRSDPPAARTGEHHGVSR
jgi:hypothetical protein